MATIADITAVAPSFAEAIGDREQRGDLEIGQPGSRVTTPFIVAFSERSAAIQAIYGVDESITILGSTVTRRVPLKHPEFAWMEARRVRFMDKGWSDDDGTRSHCYLDVEFEAPPYSDTGELPYVEFRGGPANRTVGVPGALRTTGGVAPAHDPGAIAAGEQFELVVHNLPSIFGALAYLQGFTNRSNAGLFLGAYPEGTVLCDGPSWQASRSAGNVEVWTLGISFRTTYRYPWNFEVLADGTIGEIFYGGTGLNADRRHPLVNMNSIFAF